MSERIDTAELRRLVEAYNKAASDSYGEPQEMMDNLFLARHRLSEGASRIAPPLLDELERLEGIVEDLADPEPCRLDHHGYCQEHAWLTTERPCPQRRIAEAARHREGAKP